MVTVAIQTQYRTLSEERACKTSLYHPGIKLKVPKRVCSNKFLPNQIAPLNLKSFFTVYKTRIVMNCTKRRNVDKIFFVCLDRKSRFIKQTFYVRARHILGKCQFSAFGFPIHFGGRYSHRFTTQYSRNSTQLSQHAIPK